MSEIKAQSLVKKLAEVMLVIERIPKRGHNDFHDYDYATEADIVSAIRAELAKRHVMLLPAITGTTREKVGEKGSVLTHLTMEFTFFDGESGETLMRPWLGAGTDKEDKGAYKAMTGGEKYFLLKTFLIPTGDDPEANETPAHKTTEERTADRQQHAQQTAATVATIQAKRAPQAAPTTLPPTGTFTRVKSVDEKTGATARGPWKLWVVKFADGREGTTFDVKIALAAEAARDAKTPIEPTIVPGSKPGKFELHELTPVRQQKRTADPEADDILASAGLM